MTRTSIGWTDFSSNPIKYRDRQTGKVVWACIQAADECRNCYAEALGLRWGKGRPFTRPNLALVEPFLDHIELRTLLTSKLIVGRRLFLGDMTDIFGDWVPDAWLDAIFAAFGVRSDVTWQILTKRPTRLAAYTNDPSTPERIDAVLASWAATHGWCIDELPAWPLPNVHGGTSAGSQRTADLFVPELLRANLAVRWLSAEPLIDRLDLEPFLVWYDSVHGEPWGPRNDLHWVAVGGESGAKHRQMDLAWLGEVVDQCAGADVPVYVKQDSGHHPGRRGRIPDALWVHQFPSVSAAST
jgi:protein gp37